MKSFGFKFYSLLAGFALLLCAGGCVKNEFSIKFEFPKEFIGNYMVTYHAWDSHKGVWLEATASVQEGTAKVPCVTRRPTLVYLHDASSPSSYIILYAERGDKLVISGSSSDMSTWSVTGNDISEQWCKWRNASAGKDIAKAIENFVSKNPDNKLSTIMMLTEWDRNADPDGFVRIWNSIAKDVRKQEIIEMCGAPDFPGIEFTVTADGNLHRAKVQNVSTLILRTRANGIDTLDLDKAKTSLLYFFEENNSAHGLAIDTIKVLSKEYPDSTNRIIADISVQTDSMSWVTTLRRDTLQGVIHGWMPHGIADHKMVRFGIGRVPWMMVTGKEARCLYSGNDIEKAAAAFRKGMSAKEKATTDGKSKQASKNNQRKH